MKTWPLLLLLISGAVGAEASVVSYSTYLGGSGWDEATAIAVDSAGNAYVTGWTESIDFPLGGGLPAGAGSREAFVIKLAPDGTPVYSTFLGGSGIEFAWSIAVDASGHAYATGQTGSGDFPRVRPLPPALDGSPGAYVVKLSLDGSSPVYSVVLRGASGEGIAVDPQGRAYITGRMGIHFPFGSALLPCNGGVNDFYVAKLTSAGSDLAYLTCVGGSGEDDPAGIAVDAAGSAYVTGATKSSDFPLVGAVQTSHRGGVYDAFVTKLAPSGAGLLYSTYLGGQGFDYTSAIAVDAAGSAWVTGFTNSADFPVLRSLQPSGYAFLAQLGPGGSLASSSRFGGSQVSEGLAVAVDRQGNVYVGGLTHSPDFPLKDPVQDRCAPVNQFQFCRADGFVLKLDPKIPRLLFSTYLGGTDSPEIGNLAYDAVQGIAVDPRGGGIYAAGRAASSDFPLVRPLQATFGGGSFDAFAARIAVNPNHPPVCAAASASPSTILFINGKLTPVAIRGVTDPDSDPLALRVTAIRQDEPTLDGPDASGVGTSSPKVRAERTIGGDGRVYHIYFDAADGQGGVCSGKVTVCIPPDHRAGATCRDGGPRFDSTGGA